MDKYVRLTTKSRFLNDYFQNRVSEMKNTVQTADDEQLNEINYITYTQALIKKFSIQPLLLHLDGKEISSYQETLSENELRADIFNPFSSGRMEKTVLRCHLPISGDATLLELDPMRSNRHSLPTLIFGNGEICFDVFLNPNQPEKSTETIQKYIEWIQQQISNINNDASIYNEKIKIETARVVQQKREKINRKSDALATLGIPMRKKSFQTLLSNNIPLSESPEISQYYSVAISYGELDKKTATEINFFLKKHGVPTWFFEEDKIPGKKLHRTMTELANKHDKVILLCSKSSLCRNGVLNEIECVLARETKDGGSEVLIPIALDDYVFEEWEPKNPDIAIQIKSRIIVKIDRDIRTEKSQNELGNLLKSLIKKH